jgi:protein-disulfide isomerase
VWVVASVGLIVFFPHEQTVSAQVAEQDAAPTETLDANQLAEWHQWLDRQMPVTEAAVLPSGPVKVLVVKFNDFQCPACRQAYFAYKGIFEKYEKQYPAAFKFENKDYPLETECGMGGQHQFACEAAVAVRLAREKGKDKELENWLFSTQDEFSRDHMKQGLQQIAGVKPEDYESRYSTVSKEIRDEAGLGSRLGVTGTPTFFINGIKVPSLRPAYLDAAIGYLLQKAAATS